MVTHTRNWCSAFNPSKCTHTAVSSEHTHCEHTPGAVGSHCSSARGAVGGSVPYSRAPQSWYWRRRERCSFTIPTFNPCRTWDSNPQPLDYKSDSLTIRPQLPLRYLDHGQWARLHAHQKAWDMNAEFMLTCTVNRCLHEHISVLTLKCIPRVFSDPGHHSLPSPSFIFINETSNSLVFLNLFIINNITRKNSKI